MEEEKLFEQVKRKLDVTWDDSDTDEKIREIMLSAVGIISHQLGIKGEYNFTVPGIENTLVLSLCLYLWNNTELKLFYENYETIILQARAIHEVKEYADGNLQ